MQHQILVLAEQPGTVHAQPELTLLGPLPGGILIPLALHDSDSGEPDLGNL
jgi:hypothetical protein